MPGPHCHQSARACGNAALACRVIAATEGEMVHYNGLGTEERARIREIQDLLIELYVDRKNALTAGMTAHARHLDQEIDDLLQEKAEIEKSVMAS
jgi:hypothetical protein